MSMRKIFLLGIVCGLLLCGFLYHELSAQPELPKQLSIGVIRGANSEETYSQLANFLQEGLFKYELRVTLHYYNDEETLLDTLQQDGVQMAFVSGIGQALYGSKGVIAAENLYPYQESVYPYYTSLLLKRKQVEEEPLTYCVLNATSVAGYMFVAPYFEGQGLVLKDMPNVRQVANYASGMEMLASGECDVAAGYRGMMEEYASIWEDYEGSTFSIYEDLEVIYESEPIYGSAVVVSPTILKQDRLKKEILALLKKINYSESTDQYYQVLSERIEATLGGKGNE